MNARGESALLQPPFSPATPYRVLFVCTGNISRSAYAEAAARARTPASLAFSSAGTHALVGHPIDPAMVNFTPDPKMATRHRARQLSRGILVNSDLVLAMEREHRRYLLDEWPDQSRKVFVLGHAARELACLPDEVTLGGLVEYLWRNRTSVPGDAVSDPYGRGDEAARAAARAIGGHLDSILPCLERLAGEYAARPADGSPPCTNLP